MPFAEGVVLANAADRWEVAREWAEAYRDTNAHIARTDQTLIDELRAVNVRAAAEPPTGRFNRETLKSRWSHKSVAVIAGLGGFGLHHMVITSSGAAGRFGSLVLDAEIPVSPSANGERCRYFASGECLECVRRCPVGALKATGEFDRQLCWMRCRSVAARFADIPGAEVCGKCATGPCALGPAA
jgi:epoxyqueuosine reductase